MVVRSDVAITASDRIADLTLPGPYQGPASF